MVPIVEQGVGVGIVPETAARRCAASMAIRAVPLSDAWAVRQLVLCVRRYNDLTAHARALVDHLRGPENRAADDAADSRTRE